MPQKKPKPTKRVPIYIRLNAEEAVPVEADRKSMPGIQPTLGGYAKHAVMSYPKLRKLHSILQQHAADSNSKALSWLEEAGL